MRTRPLLDTRSKFIIDAADSNQLLEFSTSSTSLDPLNDHLLFEMKGASSFLSKLLSQLHATSKIREIPRTLMGFWSDDSPERSVIVKRGLSTSPGSDS